MRLLLLYALAILPCLAQTCSVPATSDTATYQSSLDPSSMALTMGSPIEGCSMGNINSAAQSPVNYAESTFAGTCARPPGLASVRI